MNRLPLKARLSLRTAIDPDTGCHNWTGVTHRGYGQIRANGSNTSTHRAAYVLAKGPIPEGLQIDHLCRNRRCCNPDHLEAVTSYENMLRSDGRCSLNLRKTHCSNGHIFDDENTAFVPPNGRRCRKCERQRVSDRYYARKARAALAVLTGE